MIVKGPVSTNYAIWYIFSQINQNYFDEVTGQFQILGDSQPVDSLIITMAHSATASGIDHLPEKETDL